MSRSIHRFIGVSAAMAVLSLAATGCGGDRSERAITVDPQKSSSTTDSTQEAEVVEAPEDSAGDQLSKAQIGKALLAVSDLPAGWTATPAEDEEEESEDTVSPPKCKDVLDALDETSTDAAAEGEANFNKGGPFGTVLSQTISSYAEPVDASRVQEIADAFSDCPSFNSTDSDGTVSKVTVSPMSFGNLGDQTLAFAMTLESSAFTVSVNVAYVVIGHNVIAMVNGGLTGADGAQLEKLAKKAITKLEKTAS
ncbi:hypothetical protein SAMN04489844_1627 [Nocardioides exalbidus]|uniref:PknH-like extracellular domain-containing protein n=1 Tax=Nocardioides exalbidus TaxID=402596 RepID=A0A1H4PJ93_9ACTN|nr:hypothetical protein [Nocardioides exalbidus]SEC07495.1 hypothetical protein SAMN04489844_1627 [Nocardioides exalbidus]